MVRKIAWAATVTLLIIAGAFGAGRWTARLEIQAAEIRTQSALAHVNEALTQTQTCISFWKVSHKQVLRAMKECR